MVDSLTVKDAAKLRAALQPVAPEKDLARLTDQDLLRFLVARQGNVSKAKDMVLDHFDFRRVWSLDTRSTDFLKGGPVLFPVRGYAPLIKDANLNVTDPRVSQWSRWLGCHGGGCWHKFDKGGRPVVIELAGLHDAKGFLANCPADELAEWHIRITEVLAGPLMDSTAQRNPDGQMVAIMDCQGMGLHQLHLPALNLLKSIFAIDEANYPERLHKVFVIHPPYVFTLIWRVIKGWLDARIQAKVNILGSDFKSVLLQHIPAENLPAQYGGTCKCEHMEGGCVPKMDTKGHGRYMEDEEEELELVLDEKDFQYKTHSAHGEFHFNLEVLDHMLLGAGKATVTFIAAEALAVEVRDINSGKQVYSSPKFDAKLSRFSFTIPSAPANYNIIWLRASGKKDTEFELEFGIELDG